MFNSVRLIETSLVEQAELRLKEVSVLLNAAIGPSLAAQDYGPILDVFAASQREHGLAYFALWDNRGRMIALEGWPAAQPLPQPSQTKSIDISRDTPRFDTRIPITVVAQPYGESQFGISTRFLVEARSKLVQQAADCCDRSHTLYHPAHPPGDLADTPPQEARGRESGRFCRRLQRSARNPLRRRVGSLANAFNAMAGEIACRLKALRSSEERYRNLSDLTSDWYWEQDADFRFTHFAQQFQAVSTPGHNLDWQAALGVGSYFHQSARHGCPPGDRRGPSSVS